MRQSFKALSESFGQRAKWGKIKDTLGSASGFVQGSEMKPMKGQEVEDELDGGVDANSENDSDNEDDSDESEKGDVFPVVTSSIGSVKNPVAPLVETVASSPSPRRERRSKLTLASSRKTAIKMYDESRLLDTHCGR